MDIDQEQLNFDDSGILILNISLAVIMFGVALGIKLDDFKAIVKQPRGAIIGLLSQFVALPALTYFLVWLIEPRASLAMGMFMVAACPGGNVSNFMSSLSKGNAALSVTITAFATALSIFMTPLNFTWYAGMYAPTAEVLQEFSVDPLKVIPIIGLILVVPLVSGMFVAHKFPKFKEKITKPFKIFSILFFIGFLCVMFAANFDLFLDYIGEIIILVLAHNALALLSGYFWAWLGGLPQADRRSLSIETGIQNSGLGLAIIFAVFICTGDPDCPPGQPPLGGMAFVAAWWGIWHIVSGLSLSAIWSRIEPRPNMDGFNPLYALFKLFYKNFGFPHFYRKLDVNGGMKELPARGGMLFASNHHNAFVDPMLIGAWSRRQPRFLVRADIFANPIARAALNGLKMFPIYRREDGMGTMGKNVDILDQMVNVVVNEGSLVIFPEGTQSRDSRLRTFRKGIARIGLAAQAKLPEGAAPVHIVPVSFNYSNLTDFRADCNILYGKAISMADYMDQYKEHPAKAYRQVIAELQKRIIEGMVHVESKEHYEEIFKLKDILVHEEAQAQGKWELRPAEGAIAQQKAVLALGKIAEEAPETFTEITTKGAELTKKRSDLSLPFGKIKYEPWSMGKLLFSAWAWLWTLPLFLFGWINNGLALGSVGLIAKKLFKNDMFHMSIKIAGGPLLTFPLFYGLQTLLVYLIFDWKIALGYLISLPITCLASLHLGEWGKRIREEWRYRKAAQNQSNEVEAARKLREEIVAELKKQSI